jgi:hypothetical protein
MRTVLRFGALGCVVGLIVYGEKFCWAISSHGLHVVMYCTNLCNVLGLIEFECVLCVTF